jgi:hypothetical protein
MGIFFWDFNDFNDTARYFPNQMNLDNGFVSS